MPRATNSLLESLFPYWEGQSTAHLQLRDGSQYWVATDELVIDGQAYENSLKKAGELKETASTALNRVSIQISNVDYAWGIKTASSLRLLEKADAVVKRFYAAPGDRSTFAHRHFFEGKIIYAQADEKFIQADIVPDTTAAGICLAMRNLSPLCAWILRDDNCQYLGDALTCNKQLKSRNGCTGLLNTPHNGGWTFPENPTNSAPGSGGNDGGGVGGGGYEPPCFLAGTKVWTPYGHQPIETIRPGYHHFSFNETTGEVEEDIVDETFRHWATYWLDLHFHDGGFVRVTVEHPFWHESYQWLRADALPLGQSVWRRFGGRWSKSRLTGIVPRYGTVEVFNFRSLKNPTYFANQFGVHNVKIINPDLPYPPYQP
jgi:hypothetical protein